MDNLLNINQLTKSAEEFNIVIFIIAIILTVITSYILKFTYEIKSKSLSSKHQISSIIPLLTIIIFLVIMIVKSSLALSLGLVGALSIVRFRTPIKEPEDLIYLFLAIGLGIGYGALQIFITTNVFIVILIIIWLLSKKENVSSNNDYNLIVEIKNSETYEKINEDLINSINEVCREVKLLKIEKSDNDEISLFLSVNFENFNKIQELNKIFYNKFNSINYSIYESKTLY
jgi:hypothetical protein